MTPVLEIEPVTLSGARIRRVTGNSIAFLEARSCGVGAEINIFRSGEVIPCLHSVIKGSTVYDIPEGTEVIGAHIYATERKHNMYRAFIHLAGSLIKGFGGKLAEKVIHILHVENLTDVETFLLADFNTYPTFTNHEVGLINQAREDLRKITRVHLIAGLGIPSLGWSSSEKYVAKEYNGKNVKLSNPVLDSLIEYGGELNELVDKLAEYDIGVASEVEIDSKGTVAVTGKHEMKRDDMIKAIKARGYTYVDSVKPDTNFLIIADVNSTSSKANSARKNGTKLLKSVEELG
jgi:DNA ligase (NAD+)